MRPADVKRHWERLAQEHGTDLAATTKTSTIKQLELDALERAFRAAGIEQGVVLEAGCGNGWNCLALAERFPQLRLTGFDYVPEMVASARAAAKESGREDLVRFEVGDVLEPGEAAALSGPWDAVFTDRCLINLLDPELQCRALNALAERVRPDGAVIAIENSAATHARQNELRKLAGLPARKPPEHNRFVDDELLLAGVEEQLELVAIDDFGRLHDLVLYVLVPMINGGEVDYDHPLVAAATQLALAGADDFLDLAPIGQNRLYRFRKR
jgi:predicted O-methyltransferase YrrM